MSLDTGTIKADVIEINLLPWREDRRQNRSKRFAFSLLLMVFVGLGAGYLVAWYYDQQLGAQRERLDVIEQRASVLNKEVADVTDTEEHVALLKQRVGVFQSLQTERSLTVRVLNALAGSLQEDVYYLSLERQGDTLLLSGMARIDNGVASQMQALEAATVFGDSHFSELEANGEGHRFSLSVNQRMPGVSSQQQEVVP